MPYLEIVDTRQGSTVWPLSNPAKIYSYPLDPFQQHALVGIEEGKNILVTAKTGSGKTLVGEYLIHKVLRDGGRVFYTTPIKSLSNQKFHDLKKEFGVDKVGIMTGDIKFNPDAQVIVMTTEILRNLLFKQGTITENLGLTASLSLKGLKGVVFDEVHYINDKDRGHVWEETLILLPHEIQIVLLSATIDKAEVFAAWLGEVKQKPILFLSTQYRVVPLNHGVLMGEKFMTLMDAKDIYYDKVYRDWLESRKLKEKEYEAFQRKVKDQRAQGFEGPVDGKTRPASFVHQLNETVLLLERQKLLPALCFVFSRKGCEKYADKITTSLVTTSEAASIGHIWDFHLHPYKDQLEKLPQAIELRRLVEKGIAYHHSGLLPMLKEIIEILFTRGFIRLLFATETFSVGLNMPTKTVIFLALEKYSDGGLRTLRTDEYIQMAGRAGRRGLDPVGTVIYLPERDPIDPGEMKAMMTGGRSPIVSKMSFHYDFLLKSLQANSITWLGLMEKSYWFQQRQEAVLSTKKKLADLQTKRESYKVSEEDIEEAHKKDELEMIIKTSVNAKRKQAQRQLEQFQNTHMGPKWENLWKIWSSVKATESEIYSEKSYLQELERHTATIQPIVDFLFETGYLEGEETIAQYLTKASLTKKGIMATEINEGHPILMTELYTRKVLHKLTSDEIVTLLMLFITEDTKEKMPTLDSMNISEGVKSACYEIQDITYAFASLEKRVGVDIDYTFWDINTFWMEPIWRWLSGDDGSQICADYEIFEGNLTRTILKAVNLAEEWITLATFLEDIEMLEKMRGIEQRLKSGIATADSLYLRLA